MVLRSEMYASRGGFLGNLGLSPIALLIASRAQQADVPNGVLDIRNRGENWMDKSRAREGCGQFLNLRPDSTS